MDQKLLNEINTMRSLLGKEPINESLLDKVKNYLGLKNKADNIEPDVVDFFNALESIKEPLYQQRRGMMTHKKGVEALQIALILLGYPLPKYGVDGLFGPETANAVLKFKRDQNINESVQLNEMKLSSPIPLQKVTSDFQKERKNYKHHGVDLRAKSGTPVKSPEDGVVIGARFTSGACGGMVKIRHSENVTTRYCHLKSISVRVGDKLEKGQVFALSGGGEGDKGAGRSSGPHLHFELKVNGQLVNPMNYIEGVELEKRKPVKKRSSRLAVTPDMINIIINSLKQKGLTSQDLLPFLEKK